MGSGASTTNKTAIQPFNDSNGTTRREKDGSSTSVTQKLLDCEEQLKITENRCKELSSEVDRLSHLVTDLEGQKLDLEDRLATLENQADFYDEEKANLGIGETLKAKDQIIENLEKQIQANETSAKKTKASWRRKLKNYATQLAEEKHSSAIRIMELRQEVYRLTEENETLKKGRNTDQSAENEPKEKDNLILELSQKLMEQTETVQRMEIGINERDRELQRLGSGNSMKGSRRGQRRTRLTDGTREWSGYSHDSGLDSDVPDSAGLARRRPGSGAAASLSPLSEKGTPAQGYEDGDIAEDCNWDAASLDAESEDTVGGSPRLMAIASRLERSRSIILDPDKAQTIDNLLSTQS